MTERMPSTDVILEVSVGNERLPSGPTQERPFRIVILGDFSGRANRGVRETGNKLAEQRAELVDRDNFEEVLAKLEPQLTLPVTGDDGPRLRLSFHELDDFQPDRIFERVSLFSKLKEARAKLADSRNVTTAAAEFGASRKPMDSSAAVGARPVADNSSAPNPPRLVPGNLLDQIVQEVEGGLEPSSQSADEWKVYLQKLVTPHLVPWPDPRLPELVAHEDQTISSLMRALLHHSDFQALEAAWQAVSFLVRRVETSPQLKLYLIDVSKAELAADLTAGNDLRVTGTFKLLIEQTAKVLGGEPWALMAGNYSFEPTPEDVGLLRRLAEVASASGAPFLSAASSRVLGCSSISEMAKTGDWSGLDLESASAWQGLRELPEASYLGLALPGFLLRLPYGKDTVPIEHFNFEEMPQVPAHEDYLWGNPAFVCVLLMTQAFGKYGWKLRPGVFQEIDGLPLHIYKEDGEPEVKPCAEVLFAEQAAEMILEKGLMPLASLKGQDIVRLIRFQSLAYPPKPLSGRWGGA